MSVNSILAAVADRILLGGDIRRERTRRWSRLLETVSSIVQAAVTPRDVAPGGHDLTPDEIADLDRDLPPTREEIQDMVDHAVTAAVADAFAAAYVPDEPTRMVFGDGRIEYAASTPTLVLHRSFDPNRAVLTETLVGTFSGPGARLVKLAPPGYFQIPRSATARVSMTLFGPETARS